MVHRAHARLHFKQNIIFRAIYLIHTGHSGQELIWYIHTMHFDLSGEKFHQLKWKALIKSFFFSRRILLNTVHCPARYPHNTPLQLSWFWNWNFVRAAYIGTNDWRSLRPNSGDWRSTVKIYCKKSQSQTSLESHPWSLYNQLQSVS